MEILKVFSLGHVSTNDTESADVASKSSFCEYDALICKFATVLSIVPMVDIIRVIV